MCYDSFVYTDTRTIKSSGAVEAYITAMPSPGVSIKEQAGELFTGIRDALSSRDLRILQERVFGTKEALRIARRVRAEVYGQLDDGLEPSWLVVPEGISGQIAGIQVHAVGGGQPPEILRLGETPCGRVFRRPGGGGYVALSNISAPRQSQPVKQARLVYEKAEAALKQLNTDMLLVPRTWLWLADILSWYDDFNAVRNKFFTERGLITNGELNKMPASTGIGIRSDSGAACAMDLVAVFEPPRLAVASHLDSRREARRQAGRQGWPIEYLNTAGNQKSAFDYGSAFSRASKVRTPAGMTVFISGTASIGADGKTVCPNDACAQIEKTIANLRAVLRQMNYRDEQVVGSIAYCKSVEVERLFREKWSDLPWPYMTTIADVCRPELVFEMELTAATAD